MPTGGRAYALLVGWVLVHRPIAQSGNPGEMASPGRRPSALSSSADAKAIPEYGSTQTMWS